MRKIVLVIALSIGLSTTFAQNNTTKTDGVKAKQIGTEKWQEKIDKAEQKFQTCIEGQQQNKTLKNLKEPLKKHHEDVCEAYNEVIIALQEQLAACQDSLTVFRFFSNTEETIFVDSTLEQNGWNKKLTGSYLEQYETISCIREANHALTKVEKTIESLKLQGDKKEDIAMAISYPIKKTIAKQLDEIDKRDLSLLSPKQKEYYLELRNRRFKGILNTYF